MSDEWQSPRFYSKTKFRKETEKWFLAFIITRRYLQNLQVYVVFHISFSFYQAKAVP